MKNTLPAVDWALLRKQFPNYAEHIYRVRKDPVKLARLSQRLIGQRIKNLRQLRDGLPITPVPKVASFLSVLQRLGLVKKG